MKSVPSTPIHALTHNEANSMGFYCYPHSFGDCLTHESTLKKGDSAIRKCAYFPFIKEILVILVQRELLDPLEPKVIPAPREV